MHARTDRSGREENPCSGLDVVVRWGCTTEAPFFAREM
jgi:hypothetical protein